MSDAKSETKVRKPLAVPIYILVEEDSIILPSAKVQIVKPSELPSEGNFYVLTSEGLRVNKDTNIVKALTPVKSLPVLASFSQTAKLRLPKLPPLIVSRFHQFASEVWDKHHSECEVMLLYNQETKEYDLWCPEQTVSMASVDYTMSEALASTPAEWQWVGTIHSHCDFSAYHSGTDVDDETDMDGLHITVGHVNTDTPSLSASICVGKERATIAPEKAILGLERGTETKSKYVNTKSDDHFRIVLSDEEQAEFDAKYAIEIKNEWLPKVSKANFSSGYGNYSGGYTAYSNTTWTRDDIVDDEEEGEWVLQAGTWQFLSYEELAEFYSEGEEAPDESES